MKATLRKACDPPETMRGGQWNCRTRGKFMETTE